jgi:tetraacyldisaccharide 4'-kinase
MKIFFKPISFVYKNIIQLRNRLYQNHRLPIFVFDAPVVSVGNLTMGGTGKTPVICALIDWALEQKLRPAVVSRGYKSKMRGICEVPFPADGLLYGDEAAMVKNRFESVPFFIGADRAGAVRELLNKHDVNLVLADDAYQHRRLGRALDIVIIDCTEKLENYEMIPLGRAREPFSELKRAQFIILNKVNLVTPEEKQNLKEMITSILQGVKIPIVECEYQIGRIYRLDGLEIHLNFSEKERVLLFSALGNPKSFEELMSQKFNVCEHVLFKDHHSYQSEDMLKVVMAAKKWNIEKIVTTEKDAAKLASFDLIKDKIWVAELAPVFSSEIKGLYESILTVCN